MSKETKKAAFAIGYAEVKTPERTKARYVNETYRPIFDAVATLEEGTEVVVTLDDEKSARAAQLTVRTLAREAGFTCRETRGSREVFDDGTVTLHLQKRPLQKRAPKTDAPAE